MKEIFAVQYQALFLDTFTDGLKVFRKDRYWALHLAATFGLDATDLRRYLRIKKE